MARSGNESVLVQKLCWSISFERRLFIYFPPVLKKQLQTRSLSRLEKLKHKQRRVVWSGLMGRTLVELEMTFRGRPWLVIVEIKSIDVKNCSFCTASVSEGGFTLWTSREIQNHSCVWWELNWSLHYSVFHPVYPSIVLMFHSSIILSLHLSFYHPTIHNPLLYHLSFYTFTILSIYRSIYSSIILSIVLSTHQSMHHPSISPSIHHSIYWSIYLQ